MPTWNRDWMFKLWRFWMTIENLNGFKNNFFPWNLTFADELDEFFLIRLITYH